MNKIFSLLLLVLIVFTKAGFEPWWPYDYKDWIAAQAMAQWFKDKGILVSIKNAFNRGGKVDAIALCKKYTKEEICRIIVERFLK